MKRDDDFKLSPKDADREHQDFLTEANSFFAKNWFVADETFEFEKRVGSMFCCGSCGSDIPDDLYIFESVCCKAPIRLKAA